MTVLPSLPGASLGLLWCTEGQPVYRWSLNSAGYPCPCPPLLRPVASFLTSQPLTTPLMVLLCCNLLSLAEGGSTTVVVGVSICFAAGIVASSEGGSPPFRSVVVRSARIRSGSSLTPQRFRSGSEVRSGSAAVPQWFRASSAVAPQRFRTASEVVPHFLRTSSAAVPHYFRTTSALLPQRFRTSSALLPHNCRRNGGDPPSVILSALYAPRRIMARLVSFWLFSGCQWRALFKGTAWADCLLSPLKARPSVSQTARQ